MITVDDSVPTITPTEYDDVHGTILDPHCECELGHEHPVFSREEYCALDHYSNTIGLWGYSRVANKDCPHGLGKGVGEGMPKVIAQTEHMVLIQFLA